MSLARSAWPECPWAGSKVSRCPPANVCTRHPDFAAAESEVSVIKRKLSFAVPGALAAFVLIILSGVPLPYAAHAQSSPSVALSLSSGTAEQGGAITVTMSFGNLTEDSDRSTTDYNFRADVVDANDADADACEGDGLGVDRYMYQVDEDPEVRTGRISARCPAGDYTIKAIIASAANVELASATARFTITAPTNEPCSGGGYDPTPTPVDVKAVPIVVESTTADYFVLYVSHDVDGAEVELPVLVKKGGDGTTALAENLAALPKERYRVEKYLVSDPADVDGDCIDDITELGDPVGMNPVNPAAAIELSKGAVAISDRATFDALSLADSAIIKFTIFGADTYRPSVYFQNTNTYNSHFDFLPAIGIDPYMPGLLSGYLDYVPRFFAPDGSPGLYVYMLNYGQPFSLVDLSHTMLAASMPLLEDDLAYYMPNDKLPAYQHELTLYEASRINLVVDEDIAPKSDFSSLNQAEGYGFLRIMDLEESPNPRDVVIYDALPNELPRVAGIITTVPQTPLSHVDLRAVQDGVPNAYIGDAYRSHINSFVGKYIRYEVTKYDYFIRVATRAEIDAHFASSRPAKKQTPQRDLSVTEITPLSEVGFEDWKAFGVKAANVAVLVGQFDPGVDVQTDRGRSPGPGKRHCRGGASSPVATASTVPVRAAPIRRTATCWPVVLFTMNPILNGRFIGYDGGLVWPADGPLVRAIAILLARRGIP